MCWEDTLKVLWTLTELDFMVSLRKCKFLNADVSILGLDLTVAGYTLGLKFMGHLS